MKTCFKCNKEKPLNEFYKHKQMADGHVNKCKTCNKKDVSDHRAINIDKIKAYALPLSVRWLCTKHHSEWHKENGEGVNAH